MVWPVRSGTGTSAGVGVGAVVAVGTIAGAARVGVGAGGWVDRVVAAGAVVGRSAGELSCPRPGEKRKPIQINPINTIRTAEPTAQVRQPTSSRALLCTGS